MHTVIVLRSKLNNNISATNIVVIDTYLIVVKLNLEYIQLRVKSNGRPTAVNYLSHSHL